MAGQADGSIIIDTELNSDGFKAGSSELLAAIKALSEEVKNLGTTLKELFTKPFTPEVNTSSAETKVAALEAQVQELEAALEELKNAGPTSETATPNVSFGGTAQKVSDLQRQIHAVNTSVERLEATFQKAMSGSTNAMDTLDGKATALESKVAELQEMLQAAGQTKIPTEDYQWLTTEIAKANKELDRLYDRQAKMEGTGVKQNSSAWKNLQYDIQLAKQKLAEYTAEARSLEASGGAFTSGADTEQYAQMEAMLSAALQRLTEMREESAALQAEIQRANSAWAQMPTLTGTIRTALQSVGNTIRSVFSTVGNVIRHPFQAVDRLLGSIVQKAGRFVATTAKFAVAKLVSGLKACASHLAKMVTHGKSMKGQFSSLISSVKKFSMSLLGARGVYALLRKAVNAYMEANEKCVNTLSNCWTGIGNLLGPIITRLVNLVASAVAYFTEFLRLLGFTGIATSSAIGSAGNAAKEETDKLQRSLASFDDLNILNNNSSDSNSGGGSTSDTQIDAELPDWAAIMAKQLKDGDWAAAAETFTAQLNSMVENVSWAEVGSTIAYYLDGALTFLATAIKEFDWKSLGEGLGELVNNVITGVNWSNLGTVLGGKFVALIEGLGGLFSTIKWDELGKALADALTGLWDSIDWKQAAKTLSDGIVGALNTLSTAIENVDWQKVGNGIATCFKNIDYSGVFTALSNGIGTALGGIAVCIKGLIEEAWSQAVDWWYDVAYEDGEFTMQGLLEGILNVLRDIATWIKTNIFDPFIKGFKNAFGINSPSTVMAEQGAYLIQGLLKGINDAWGDGTSFGTLLSDIKTMCSESWESLKTTASTKWSSIKTTIEGILWNDLRPAASTTWDSMKQSATDSWESLKTTASTKWGNIRSTVENIMWNGLRPAASTTWKSMRESGDYTGDYINTSASSKWTKIKNTIQNISWNGIRTAVSSTWESMKQSASSAWDSIKSTASTKWQGIKTTLSNIWSNIKTTFDGLSWSSIGSNICTGIRQGISNGWESLKRWVKEKALSLLEAAKKALGIHSPSTLFRDQVGLNIGLGIGEGVDDSVPDVLESVTGVADAIAEEINAGEYEAANIIPATEVNGALESFADTITNSFSDLLNKLQSIAESVTFRMPAAASGLMPYKAASAAGEGGTDINSIIEASNDELITALAQLIGVATDSIVAAIKEYSGTEVNFDPNTMTTAIINEINRRTRMAGQSPLIG